MMTISIVGFIVFIFCAFWFGWGICAILSAGKFSDLESTIWFMRQTAIKGLNSFHSNNSAFVETAPTEIRGAE